jgi:hypothetical protein
VIEWALMKVSAFSFIGGFDMSVQIIRGTTPHITCRIAGDLMQAHLFFSIGSKSRHSWFTVEHGQMSMVYDESAEVTVVEFTLTQKQTCACNAGKAYAQFRAVDSTGNGMVSNRTEIEIVDIIKDGVIAYA